MSICHKYIFFGEASVQTVHLFFYLVVYLLIIEISLHILNISSLADFYFASIFSLWFIFSFS